MVTVAVPDLLVSWVEVARTVSVVPGSVGAIVRRPVDDIEELPVTLQVTDCDGLPVPWTLAENWWVAPRATEILDGDTVTPVMLGVWPSAMALAAVRVTPTLMKP